jgi:hypothetical protein
MLFLKKCLLFEIEFSELYILSFRQRGRAIAGRMIVVVEVERRSVAKGEEATN